eukprot:13180004-Ditylum_brightwellii.AAC.1
MRFKRSNGGLYYFNTKNKEACFMQTVKENKKMFTPRQVEGAKRVRYFLSMVGRPSMKDLTNMIKMNLVPKSPVTLKEVKVAEKIYGKDLGSIMGKTTRRKLTQVMTDRIELPKELREIHNKVTIVADLMFINTIPFMVSTSRNIKFVKVQRLLRKSKSNLFEAVRNIMSLYRRQAYRSEHVPEVERTIWLIKEQVCALLTLLLYKKYPPQMIIKAANFAVFWLNAIPTAGGTSKTLSPRVIVIGH